MDLAVTLFPLPDSPTIPHTSPSFIEKETPRTDWTSPFSVKKEVSRFLTF